MMRTIKIYVPPGQPGPLLEFLSTLDEKLRRKLLRQILRLSQIHLCDLKEPHFKHFVLEKYNLLYELQSPRPDHLYDPGRGHYSACAFHQAPAQRYHEGSGAVTQDACGDPGAPGIRGKY